MHAVAPSDRECATLSYSRRLDEDRREIRLLKVHEEDVNGLVNCELFTTSLDDDPKYAALSYVWGDPSITTPILVNGNSVFHATINLTLALRSVRSDLAMQSLWVDAICINQADFVEKAKQVSMMGKIYTGATGTLVYMGKEDAATEFLAPWHARLQSVTPENVAESMTPFEAFQFGAALRAFSGREWWQRVWVFQEAILSRADPIFYCGQHTIHGSLLGHIFRLSRSGALARHAARATLGEEEDVMPGTDWKQVSPSATLTWGTLFAIRSLPDQDRTRLPLAVFRELCGRSHATVPHDYLYGLLGMLRPEEANHITVDYSLSSQDLFRECIEKNLTSGATSPAEYSMLDFDGQLGDDSAPSWVPNFGPRNTPLLPTTLILDGKPDPEPANIHFDHIRKIMLLPGRLFGVVTSASLLLQLKDVLESQWYEGNTTQCACRSTFRCALDMFGGNHQINTVLPWDIDIVTTTCKRLQNMKVEAWSEVIERDSELLANMGTLSARLYATSLGSMLIQTNTGLRAIGIPDARLGDNVVYLEGFAAPFLLRPTRDYYNLLGALRVAGFRTYQDLVDYSERHLPAMATFRIG